MWLFQPHKEDQVYQLVQDLCARIRGLPLRNAVGSAYIPKLAGESCAQRFSVEARSLWPLTKDQQTNPCYLLGNGARRPKSSVTSQLDKAITSTGC